MIALPDCAEEHITDLREIVLPEFYFDGCEMTQTLEPAVVLGVIDGFVDFDRILDFEVLLDERFELGQLLCVHTRTHRLILGV
jgi:hypothetical protein